MLTGKSLIWKQEKAEAAWGSNYEAAYPLCSLGDFSYFMNANIRKKLWKNKSIRLNLYSLSKFMNTQDILTNKQGQLESSSCSTQNFLNNKIWSF